MIASGEWSDILPHLKLEGRALTLASRCLLIHLDKELAILMLENKDNTLLPSAITLQIQAALQTYLDNDIKIIINYYTCEN